MGRLSGKYDRELVFERTASTGYGVERREVFGPLVTLRGKRMIITGGASNTQFVKNQEYPSDVLKFECRFHDGINKSTDRFTEAGVVYDILDVDEIGRREALIIYAKKRVDGKKSDA